MCKEFVVTDLGSEKAGGKRLKVLCDEFVGLVHRVSEQIRRLVNSLESLRRKQSKMQAQDQQAAATAVTMESQGAAAQGRENARHVDKVGFVRGCNIFSLMSQFRQIPQATVENCKAGGSLPLIVVGACDQHFKDAMLTCQGASNFRRSVEATGCTITQVGLPIESKPKFNWPTKKGEISASNGNRFIESVFSR